MRAKSLMSLCAKADDPGLPLGARPVTESQVFPPI
jgi:hypothetical protein